MIEQYSWSDDIDSAKHLNRPSALRKANFARIRFSASKGVLARRPMDPNITQEILDDLIPSLEALEAKSTAVLEFLKGEGIASDDKLTPYLERAASASNVRWLGVRVRVERLLSAAEKDSAQKQPEKEEKKPETGQTKAAEASQSQPEAGDNSKSAGPENPNENNGKDRNTETTRKDSESKSTVAANDSTGNDRNRDRPQTSEESAATGAEPKVA
jgi:hypothetical protein